MWRFFYVCVDISELDACISLFTHSQVYVAALYFFVCMAHKAHAHARCVIKRIFSVVIEDHVVKVI